jgi:hypothetical protein
MIQPTLRGPVTWKTRSCYNDSELNRQGRERETLTCFADGLGTKILLDRHWMKLLFLVSPFAPWLFLFFLFFVSPDLSLSLSLFLFS